MSGVKLTDELSSLHEDVLEIVVSEAEAMVQAQLSVATAADQRTLAIAGFTVTASSASIAGILFLHFSNGANQVLVVAAIIFSLGMITSTVIAVLSVKVGMFCLPGQNPRAWSPSDWQCGVDGPHDRKQALLEQADCLQKAIDSNKARAAKGAYRINSAIYIALSTLAVTVIVLLATIVCDARL